MKTAIGNVHKEASQQIDSEVNSPKIDAFSWADKIVEQVQKNVPIKQSRMDHIGEEMLRPMPGIPIALIVLTLALGIVVGGGRALGSLVLLPLVNGLIVPNITAFVERFVSEGILCNVLVGEFGVLVKGKKLLHCAEWISFARIGKRSAN